MSGSSEPFRVLDALRSMEGSLNGVLKEREEVIRALVLSLLSGEHLFLVGPPGTGKSLLIRLCAAHFPCLVYFERLLHQESARRSLESSPLMKEGIADGAIVFLDEVLRAPKSLLLTLLSFMNERIWHDPEPRPAHLLSLFAASNTHPSQSDHLDAFFDRFALRCLIEPVRQFDSFSDLLEEHSPTGEAPRNCAQVSLESFRAVREGPLREVRVEKEIIKKLWNLRHRLGREGISLSDRRWKLVVKVLKAIALYEGSEKVDATHLSGLLPVLWTYPPEIRTIRRILSSE